MNKVGDNYRWSKMFQHRNFSINGDLFQWPQTLWCHQVYFQS